MDTEFTSYQQHSEDGFGLLLDQIAADIGRAPVEPWLKTEAIDRLDRIAQFVQATQKDQENTLSELAAAPTLPEVDDSWRRMQIVEALIRNPVVPPSRQIIEKAKEIEEWVRNG